MTFRRHRSAKFRSVHRNICVRSARNHLAGVDRKGMSGRAFSRRHHGGSLAIASPQFGRFVHFRSRSSYDERGRQKSFRESSEQRRERVAFIRRQGLARKQVRDEPSGQPCNASDATPLSPWSRVQIEAAIKIQRAYRAHRTVVEFTLLEHRIKFAASQQARKALSHLRARAADLGALGALLDAEPRLNRDPRILKKAQVVTKALCQAIDRAEAIVKAQRVKLVWVNERRSDFIGGFGGAIVFPYDDEDDSSSDNEDFEDIIHEAWQSKKKELKANKRLETVDELDDESTWVDVSSAGSDCSDSPEEFFEYGTGVPEDVDEGVSKAHRTAIISLCSGSRQQREWISRILAAPTLKTPGRRRMSVSKVPALLTISEETETEV